VKANSFGSVKGKLDAQRRLQQIVLQDILATATESTQFPLESSKARSFMTVQENSFVQRKLDGSIGSSGTFAHTTKPNLQQTLKFTSRPGTFAHTTKPNLQQTLKLTSRPAGAFTHTTKANVQQTLKVTSRPATGPPFGQSCHEKYTPVSCNKTDGCKWVSRCQLKYENCSRYDHDQSSCSAAKKLYLAGRSFIFHLLLLPPSVQEFGLFGCV